MVQIFLKSNQKCKIPGNIKTNEQIQQRYTGITRQIVEKFRTFCYICNLNTNQIKIRN